MSVPVEKLRKLVRSWRAKAGSERRTANKFDKDGAYYLARISEGCWSAYCEAAKELDELLKEADK